MNKEEYYYFLQACLFAWEDDGKYDYRCDTMKIPLKIRRLGVQMADYCKGFIIAEAKNG